MLTLSAQAKLNLYLHITGKRKDGYHLLESLVVFTHVHDVLTIAPSDLLALDLQGEFADEAGKDDNLVMRAGKLLQRQTGKSLGAKLTLHKNIPVGAGLGGGSADAAAALTGLNQFWQLGLDQETLMQLGSQLGADVPMCLVGQPLMARGIGDDITALDRKLPSMYAVLVHPRIPLLTKHVYAMLDCSQWVASPALPSGNVVEWLAAHTRNDLQRAAIAVSPIVAEVLLTMETVAPRPELVRMTGSGACCFALFGDADRAATYAAAIRAQYPTWWVQVTAITQPR